MRKPWNLPSYPVYSLLTEGIDRKQNMNIMTYVMPVSMKPKHYILAIYHDTQTLDNWRVTHTGILQMLAPEHATLVGALGKKSGKSYDKTRYLTRKGCLSDDGLLIGIAGYIELEEIRELPDGGGDHTLYLCRVIRSESLHEKVLHTDQLIEQKIIL